MKLDPQNDWRHPDIVGDASCLRAPGPEAEAVTGWQKSWVWLSIPKIILRRKNHGWKNDGWKTIFQDGQFSGANC